MKTILLITLVIVSLCLKSSLAQKSTIPFEVDREISGRCYDQGLVEGCTEDTNKELHEKCQAWYKKWRFCFVTFCSQFREQSDTDKMMRYCPPAPEEYILMRQIYFWNECRVQQEQEYLNKQKKN